MATRCRRRIVVAACMVAAFCAGPASADDKAPNKIQCIAADTDGQSLRLEGKLHAARERLAVCASASCPAIVREDCVQRIDDITRAMPTVLFHATNGNGHPVTDVRVIMDGTVLAERLDGQPLAIDPGDHVFTFQAVGREDAEMRISISEGDKERHGVVLRALSGDVTGGAPPVLAPAPRVNRASRSISGPPRAPAPVAPVAPEPAAPQEDVDPKSTRRNAVIAAGAVGILGVGLGTLFGIITMSDWNAAQRDCGASCPASSAGQREERSASANGTASTIAFVAGGAGLATAAILWFAVPNPVPPGVGMRVVPRVGPGRGEVVFESRF
jgi:hypothetical protein